MANATDTLPHAPSQPSRSARGGPITGHQHRRALLGALAAVPLAGAAPALALTGDPDAALLQAWEDWRAAQRAYIDAPRDQSEEDHGRLWRSSEMAEDQVRELPAHTLAGLAIKLRLVFADWAIASGDPEAHEALAYGTTPTADTLESHEATLIWSVVELADRLAGGRA
jgi:hypothetical protein